jgi:hypothetical protein
MGRRERGCPEIAYRGVARVNPIQRIASRARLIAGCGTERISMASGQIQSGPERGTTAFCLCDSGKPEMFWVSD